MPLARGSSPHARGARRGYTLFELTPRLIPACAGSTQHRNPEAHRITAHPRMRGEHRLPGAVVATMDGSSPHARGALRDGFHPGDPCGLIPACAGSTEKVVPAEATSGAHPRMRGEHLKHRRSESPNMGSSPHARGARRRWRACDVPAGLIPACAGSTPSSPRRQCAPEAHPRMRGEHSSLLGAVSPPLGSSPHARGARNRRRVRRPHAGLIPACAGNTDHTRRRPTEQTAHPRMRGEHSPVDSTVLSDKGSSPHARGAR